MSHRVQALNFPYFNTVAVNLRDGRVIVPRLTDGGPDIRRQHVYVMSLQLPKNAPLGGSGSNVGIGITNPQYLLSVNGAIGAQDIVVTNTGWSDYVFRPGYRLRPLSEVHKFIQTHHHLPDIPTDAEVKEKGVSVGEMQARLLAKIEELTLHMIQQEKENQELRDRIARLEASAAGATAK
jgi:hypothetical protein